MKVFLMYKDRDFNLNSPLCELSENTAYDLELDTIFKAMAKEDEFFYKVSKKAVLESLVDVETILYRQEILKDCIKNDGAVKKLYDIAVQSIEFEKKAYFLFFNKYPESVLHSSVRLMEMFTETLNDLKNLAVENRDKFSSEGFKRFFEMVEKELSDDYFALIKKHLKNLEFRGGMLISAELGSGNRGKNYILRELKEENRSFVERIFSKRKDSYLITIHERDEAGAKALGELRNKGINSVANAVFKSAKHILNFFEILKTEVAFYLAAVNLYKKLKSLNEQICFPVPLKKETRKLVFSGLYDVCLALTLNKKVVDNTLDTKDKNISLFIITGANHGGKSTFLRSVGLAKLMMQCGMFVAADSFSSNINSNIFTHYKRKEDVEMESGKFDEEMKRMSLIVDKLKKDSLVLFNESFASTNEIEGSEVSKQIVSALMKYGTEMLFVTHMYKFAGDFYEKGLSSIMFLRAERKDDGSRTYKIEEGKPLKTSHGKDIYRKVFG